MTYTITSECISCQRCLSACPTQAIATDGTTFWIAVDHCNRCEGSHGVPQCWMVCPTNHGCVPLDAAAMTLSSSSETSSDYWEAWFAKYVRLVARLQTSQQPTYWRNWFNAYAQALRNLQIQYASGSALLS